MIDGKPKKKEKRKGKKDTTKIGANALRMNERWSLCLLNEGLFLISFPGSVWDGMVCS